MKQTIKERPDDEASTDGASGFRASGRNYVIISAVRDEARYIKETLDSVVNQAARPLRWVIVDDGSMDGTVDIVRRYSKSYPWIELVQRQNRGYRQSGIGVVEAFYAGYPSVLPLPWAYLCKLDGDVSLEPNYFLTLIAECERDERLGICGGDVYNESNGRLVLDSTGDPLFHVRGAAKLYRRQCWEAIGGIPRVTGWDGADDVRARMLGWDTRRLAAVRVIHFRRTGRATGTWRNCVKDGMGSNAIGYHPLYLLARCCRRAIVGRSPLGALGLLFGYLSGYGTRFPRITDKEFVSYLRQQQLNRLFGRASIWH